jgi:hypothetical protein
MRPERVCTIVTACSSLHNIAIDHNEALPECEDDEPWNEDDNFAGVETGQAVRNHIANTYFNLLYYNYYHSLNLFISYKNI